MSIELPSIPPLEPAETYAERHLVWWRNCDVALRNEQLTLDAQMIEAQRAMVTALANSPGEGFSEAGVLSLVGLLQRCPGNATGD